MAEDVLPHMPGQTLLAKKAPEWSTGVQRSVSGRRRTTAYYAAPVWSFQINYNAVRKRPGLDEWTRLVEFFNERKGQFGDFLFFDRTDHQVTKHRFGFGDGVTRTFQLSRSIGGWVEPIYGVVNIEVLTVGGVLGTAYSVDALGAVTFPQPPAVGAALEWTGAFFFRCAYDSDSLDSAQPFGKIWEMKNVSFTSIKP
ncbi:DUF2460 domain-containing protein [Pseudomonas sp. IPO3749]|uniref:DUF2460 domain-containing protein n=2 Tax=Pseudomonas TaxID=286 RepID=A0A0A1YZE9_PSEFL|nr:hypothetical protein K814_0120090 [Pseudomonas fluorescens LMG 5329]NWE02597.1 DUF2460 domain-containing protein [Pseudomonas sp. IPO3749]NWF22361.1 DUF2460 domain-containing protein [Pseudomonas sp. IPO3749]